MYWRARQDSDVRMPYVSGYRSRAWQSGRGLRARAPDPESGYHAQSAPMSHAGRSAPPGSACSVPAARKKPTRRSHEAGSSHGDLPAPGRGRDREPFRRRSVVSTRLEQPGQQVRAVHRIAPLQPRRTLTSPRRLSRLIVTATGTPPSLSLRPLADEVHLALEALATAPLPSRGSQHEALPARGSNVASPDQGDSTSPGPTVRQGWPRPANRTPRASEEGVRVFGPIGALVADRRPHSLNGSAARSGRLNRPNSLRQSTDRAPYVSGA